MILILSEESEVSTQNVIDWLLYLRIPYFRVNETCRVQIDYLTIRNGVLDFKLSITNPFFSTPFSVFAQEIKGYWYRRGFFLLQMPLILGDNFSELNVIKEGFNKYLVEENEKVVDFFHKYFRTIPHLGYFHDNFSCNKINNLYQAQKENILIPDFVITKNKSDVELFLKDNPFCITKGIDRNGFHIKHKISIGNLAKLVTTSEIKKSSTRFNYSFIQQYIDKKADVRVFYLDGKVFSTAIFSQNDEQTKIDFRNYNDERPNRIVPFKLPIDEEKKLRKLMKKMKYKTGSIDYVLDKNNNLYFLEINPIGQYGFISNKCNLFLDKAICNYFKSKCHAGN